MMIRTKNFNHKTMLSLIDGVYLIVLIGDNTNHGITAIIENGKYIIYDPNIGFFEFEERHVYKTKCAYIYKVK